MSIEVKILPQLVYSGQFLTCNLNWMRIKEASILLTEFSNLTDQIQFFLYEFGFSI